MKIGKVYYKQLTDEQKEIYKVNSSHRFEVNMIILCDNFRDFILKSFKWKETPQGEEYWKLVSEGNNER